jgi:hypothetical protein
MGETLLQFQLPVAAPDGTTYEARACGAPMRGGMWQGWIEFVPVAGGDPIRSPRETTQPNRIDTEYWATGLSAVYLEGALRRALATPMAAAAVPSEPSIFLGPAARPPIVEAGVGRVLDPFPVYERGEQLLRQCLGGLSVWHLVDIIKVHELAPDGSPMLNGLSGADLIEIIVSGVRAHRPRGRDGRAL